MKAGIKMSLPSKKNQMTIFIDRLNAEFEKELDQIYDGLFSESLGCNNKTVTTFLVNNEAEKISSYIKNKIPVVRSHYIEAIQKAEYIESKPYTYDQAVDMWRQIAGQIEPPKLKKFCTGNHTSITGTESLANKSLTSKDKAALTLAGVGVVNIVVAGAITAPLVYIPSIGAILSFLLSGGVLVQQYRTDRRTPFQGLFHKSSAGKQDGLNKALVKEAINTQMNITLSILKKWGDGIATIALAEEPII